MKYLNVILTITVICLLFIGWNLRETAARLGNVDEACRLLISSNQALINANARLEAEITELKKEIQAVKENLPRK